MTVRLSSSLAIVSTQGPRCPDSAASPTVSVIAASITKKSFRWPAGTHKNQRSMNPDEEAKRDEREIIRHLYETTLQPPLITELPAMGTSISSQDLQSSPAGHRSARYPLRVCRIDRWKNTN